MGKTKINVSNYSKVRMWCSKNNYLKNWGEKASIKFGVSKNTISRIVNYKGNTYGRKYKS